MGKGWDGWLLHGLERIIRLCIAWGRSIRLMIFLLD